MSKANDERETLHRIALGRAEVLSRAEYYADILLNLSPVIVYRPKVTMGVTKHLVLYVNPDWFLRSRRVGTTKKVAGLLVHECEHPLRGIDRLEALEDLDTANIAGDAAINYNEREEGWELPAGGIYPENYGLPGGKTLEWYYHKLKELCEEHGCSDAGELTRKMRSDGGEGEDDGESDDEEQEPGIATGACGGIGGHSLDPDLEAELDAEHGKSDAEVEAIRRQTLEAIETHMAQHGRGSVPGRFEELIKTKIKPPRVNWRAKLRQVIRRSAMLAQSGGRDYSLSRPAMSSAFTGAIMSGLVDCPLCILLVRDTSLSMATPQLEEANNEIYHAIKKSSARDVWLMDADTHIHRCELIRPRQVQKLACRGRGGTDFRLVFKEAAKLRPRPNLIIYATDGDGYAPTHPPRGIETIWCIVRTPYARKPADWGHVVVCDKNQALMPPVMVDLEDE